MRYHSRFRRTAAILLSTAILICCTPVYAADDGVKPTYDEAYYATTDYYGNLTQGSVVKSYTTNGATRLTDYGSYDEVSDLTNGRTPSVTDGKTVFTFDEGDTPEHFYFEGKTSQPFEELPWTISVHYSLNGVTARAEELAGKTGLVEITVDAVPNESASEYARNNYTLEAMAVFNQDDILSLEAPGAQVQLIGNIRAALFIGLPGEECHFTIRVGSEDFSFGGMTFLMVPATLSQLEEIAKLAQRKDELEDDYDKLSGSLDTLLDSLNGISSGLYATANGLDSLDAARDTVSSNKADLYAKADNVREDLDAISTALKPVSEDVDNAGAAIASSKTELGKLTEQVVSLRTELKKLDGLIEDIQDHKDDFDTLFEDLTDMRSDLHQLEKALNSAKNTTIPEIDPLFGGMTEAQLTSALTQAEGLHDAYKAGNSGSALSFRQFMLSALLAAGKASAEANSTANSLGTFYDSYYTQFGSKEEAYTGVYQATYATAVDGGAVDAAAAAAADAKGTEAATAWETVHQMNAAFTAAGGADGSPLDFQGFLYAALTMKGMSDARSTAESLYKLWRLNDADPGLTQVLLMESGDLNTKVDELNDVISQANKLIGKITDPTADLVGALAELCSELDELSDLASTGHSFGDLAGDTTGKLTAILDEVDALYKILDEYEPQLQDSLKTVKTLSESAGKTLTDTGSFFDSFEEVAKTAGTQLDEGTKQTLSGLASALRATAGSLSTTDDVKAAKDDISSIIEDTWNEYTGDVNNLLLIDADAEAVSLTDERNDAPQSIQVLIRTQEIKEDDGAKEELAEEETEKTTFWQRVAQMFRDIWNAVTGIFTGKD